MFGGSDIIFGHGGPRKPGAAAPIAQEAECENEFPQNCAFDSLEPAASQITTVAE